MSVDSEDPTCPNDKIFFKNHADGVLAQKLTAPVNVDGLFFVVNFVGRMTVAAEDVIGTDINHFRADFAASFRNPTSPEAVHRQSKFLFALRLIDCSISRAVNDGIGLFVENEIFRARLRRQFQFLKRRRNIFFAAFG